MSRSLKLIDRDAIKAFFGNTRSTRGDYKTDNNPQPTTKPPPKMDAATMPRSFENVGLKVAFP